MRDAISVNTSVHNADLSEILRQIKEDVTVQDAFKNAFRELWFKEEELDGMIECLVETKDAGRYLHIKENLDSPEELQSNSFNEAELVAAPVVNGMTAVPYDFDEVLFTSDYEKDKFAKRRETREQEEAALRAAIEADAQHEIEPEPEEEPTNLDRIEDLFEMGY